MVCASIILIVIAFAHFRIGTDRIDDDVIPASVSPDGRIVIERDAQPKGSRVRTLEHSSALELESRRLIAFQERRSPGSMEGMDKLKGRLQGDVDPRAVDPSPKKSHGFF